MPSNSDNFIMKFLIPLLTISNLILFVTVFVSLRDPSCNIAFKIPSSSKVHQDQYSPTNISHLVFGILGSEQAFHKRKSYVEAWWRPNITRGSLCLDTAPTGDLTPWSPKSPPYRVSADLTQLLAEIRPESPVMARMVYGIMEVFREHEPNGEMRWLVMGDDDSMFFVDNLVDVLSVYDHTKYYYLGYPSEYVLNNNWLSFNQAFGGGGIILSYPLAKALANSDIMDRCLRTYGNIAADKMTMLCLADLGANLTPHKGAHQNDLVGDYSGFLSSHPKELILSIHHFDTLDPIFPLMNRSQSAEHIMMAGNVDQSRLFQQTICHYRPTNWSFSISWGYSAYIYEKIMPRSWLMTPLETFQGWNPNITQEPLFMFNTRKPSHDPCEAPHVFFLESVGNSSRNDEIVTIYARNKDRDLPACSAGGNHSAEFVTEIQVFSSGTKRPEIQRAECCDVVDIGANTGKAEVKFRECREYENIA